MDDEHNLEQPEDVEELKLTKKGQKPRKFSEEHLEKLKLARLKARETQMRNKEIRQMEKENKAEEERRRKEAIIAKNKEIKNSLKKMPNEPVTQPSTLEVFNTQEKVVEEEVAEEEEQAYVIEKKAKKKKPKKPIVIVEQSSSDSEDDQQVVYVKKKSKKKDIEAAPIVQPQVEQQPDNRRYIVHNPFHNLHYKKY